eukprot:TRINITY_DN21620_c0_g1_i6.p1 TRINITY_DN21620_c0_g1~~TRINITY_DN21620_c0_g1_i6.p1  ORF type:complete len:295 (+),score=30.23 TRINITY_DN21620_c0_g1_i6:328-1212(+)
MTFAPPQTSPAPRRCRASALGATTSRREPDNCFAVALRRGGGAVCQWRLGADRNGNGVAAAPEAVRGLPSKDAVVTIKAGLGITAALTASGAAYCWGHRRFVGRFGASGGAAARVPALGGCRIRRFACVQGALCAEAEDHELVVLDLGPPSAAGASSAVRLDAAEVAFPLRQLTRAGQKAAMAIDAVGATWWVLMRINVVSEQRKALLQEVLPGGRRAVRIGGRKNHFAVLTEGGNLFVAHNNILGESQRPCAAGLVSSRPHRGQWYHPYTGHQLRQAAVAVLRPHRRAAAAAQ